MAEILSDDMDTRVDAWPTADVGGEQDAVRAWARERIVAGTSEELAVLLAASAKPREVALRRAVRQTVEKQLVVVRDQRFEVRTVAIPVCVVGRHPIDGRMLRMDDLLPAIRRILVRAGVIHAKGDGLTVLSRMVPHGSLRELSYAQMFEASRQIFHSAVVSSAQRQRVHAFRTAGDVDDTSVGGYSIFCGYILGCIYRRTSASVGSGGDLGRVQQEIGDLMRANFAQLDVEASSVQVGQLAPVYEAMDACLALRAQAFATTVINELDGVVSHVVTRYSNDPTDQDSTVMNLEFMAALSGRPVVRLGLVFNHMEQSAIGHVQRALDAALGDARVHQVAASIH